jgi:tetratricopeptide (TPR) repeat protein
VPKAAAAYSRAWKLLPSNAVVGITAAHLWADQLAQPVEAARILRELLSSRVLDGPEMERERDDANNLLKSLQRHLLIHAGILRSDCFALMDLERLPEALACFNQCRDVIPEADSFAGIASVQLRLGRKDLAIEAFRDAARYSRDQLEFSLKDPVLLGAVQQGDLAQSLSEILDLPTLGRIQQKYEINRSLLRECAGNWRMQTVVDESIAAEGGFQIQINDELNITANGHFRLFDRRTTKPILVGQVDGARPLHPRVELVRVGEFPICKIALLGRFQLDGGKDSKLVLILSAGGVGVRGQLRFENLGDWIKSHIIGCLPGLLDTGSNYHCRE